jgi:hypothetical protein
LDGLPRRSWLLQRLGCSRLGAIKNTGRVYSTSAIFDAP